jgi:hypothetical protein
MWSPRRYFLRHHPEGAERQPPQAHEPQGKQDEPEPPTTADTAEPVLHPHAPRSPQARLPAVHEEAERGDPVAQTGLLQGQQLVGPGGSDDGAGEYRTVGLPGEDV